MQDSANNKDMFGSHGHTKTHFKTTINYTCCHNLPNPKGEHMLAIGTHIWEFLNNFISSVHSAALRTTTRTCSEVMGIQKHVSKRQLLMLLFLENLRHSLHWMRGTTVFYKNLHLKSFITFYSILATNSTRMNPEMFTHLFHKLCLLFLV